MTRQFITESYQYIQERLDLPEYHILEPLFMQSMSNVFDELEKIRKERDYWKLSFEKQVEASRR
jgi:hypothetical protein